MADPVPRQPTTRQGSAAPLPAATSVGTGPPRSGSPRTGPPPPGWVPAPPRPTMPRYAGPPGSAPYYPPGQRGPVAPPPGARPGARGPGPGGVPGRPRPGEPTQAVGTQRPRPPAGVVPRTDRQGPYPPGRPQAGGKARLVRDVRNRRLVRRVDVLSVFKISLAFYFCMFLVFMVAGVALWNVAAAFGVINSLDKLIRSLFALTSFQLRPVPSLIWGAAVGACLCLLGSLLNVVAAVFYNLISDVVGGVQVIVLDERDG